MAYVVALLIGAVILAALLYLVGRLAGHPPLAAVGTIALISAGVGSTRLAARLPTSTWQVPRSWARFGHTAFAAVFGGILGLGFVTVMPSIGFYTLVAWALTAPRWHDVWPVFVAFGGARALLLPLIALRAQWRGEDAGAGLERFRVLADCTYSGEIALLTTIGVLCVAFVNL